MPRYQPRAEPTIDTYQPGRPAYVSRAALSTLAAAGPSAWRRCWRLGATVTTVERDDGIIVRSWTEWGGPAELLRAAAWWQARNLKACSPGGLLLQAARSWYRPCPWTLRKAASAGFVGGWEEAQVRGIILGPHKVLDLRKAYRWALTAAPFPDRHHTRVARQWLPADPGLHLVECDPVPGAPWPLRDGGRVLVETPGEAVPIRRWFGGVTWSRTVDTRPLGDLLDAIGVAALYRSYWGMWAAATAVVCDFRSGAQTRLRPFGADQVRAHLIVQRVRRRMAEIPSSYRYVDAVIVPAGQAVPTGEAIGDWRVVREYPDGIHIRWPGHYGPLTGPPDRQAGIPKERTA